MRVLDLFAGLGGFSRPFRDRGHAVVTVDLNPSFDPDLCVDVRELGFPSTLLGTDRFDVVLASPPCERFSVASIRYHWKDFRPSSQVAEALGVVACAVRLIAEIGPTYWVVENPDGMLKRLLGQPKETLYLCSYGAKWKKPTDLWGRYPGFFSRACAPHEKAPRGSKRGVQGENSRAKRAELPYALGQELCTRIEMRLGNN